MVLEELWKRIGRLQGQRLRTVRGKAFEFVSVARGKAVMVVPESTGKPRGIAGEEFENA